MSDTTTTAKWTNKMSNLIRHILPGILFSFLVWCVLAHLEVLVQFAEDLIAASPFSS